MDTAVVRIYVTSTFKPESKPKFGCDSPVAVTVHSNHRHLLLLLSSPNAEAYFVI